jgi:hypothetical protein
MGVLDDLDKARFPFGKPPHDDVDAAARLLIRYEEAGKTGPEFGEMFIQSVKDPEAVAKRAAELRAK